MPDLSDSANLVIVQASVQLPQTMMRRYEAVWKKSASHAQVIIDALGAVHADLPSLVIAAREAEAAANPASPFRWRTITRTPRVHRVRVQFRLLAGELAVIDGLVDWVRRGTGARARYFGGAIDRSEVVTVALDAYLPKPKPRVAKADPAGQEDSAGA